MSKKIRDWLESFLLAGVIIAILFVFFWPFVISGNSMEPSFYDRDRIAISRAVLMFGGVSRGDFTVCRMPRDDKVETVIKRVVGLPGDAVEVRGGVVYINGAQLQEEYLASAYTSGELTLTLADDEYFLLGDNRASSHDSRAAGPVKSNDLIGRVLMRWFPFDAITVYNETSSAF